MQDTFGDAVGNITVFAGTVRIDFLKIAQIENNSNTPQYESAHRLVMPIGGFMQAADRFAALRQKLIDNGMATGTTAPAHTAHSPSEEEGKIKAKPTTKAKAPTKASASKKTSTR
jgi:hypothetical protein